MALRALMVKRKIDLMKAALEGLRTAGEEFTTREAALEKAIAEAETEEEQAAVDEEVSKFETEKKEHDDKVAQLTADIADAEKELEDIEAETPAPPAADTQRSTQEVKVMETRAFFGMNMQERDAFFKRDDVKKWIGEVRSMLGDPAGSVKRGITNGGYTIPAVVLPLIYSEAEKSSKLLKYVRQPNVPGTSRQVIMGDVPEGVWTEMCGKINEGALTFTQVELDGYKVGCFIPVCNALLEDSDIALATEIISALGQGLGYALDKAIVFGTGTKMPVGMAINIAAGSKVSLANKTGVALFQAIVKGTGKLKHRRGSLVWIMNEQTHLDLIAEAMNFNAAAAVVSGLDSKMPVIGGDIVEEDFVKDGEIIVGSGQRYVCARRAGIKTAVSTEFKFTDDQTVFKATARYDGKPVFNDAFMAFGMTGSPTAAIDSGHGFVSDTANA